MKHALNRDTDGTIEIKLTIPWNKVKTAFDEQVEKTISKTEIKGFRKGKAPRKLVLESIDKNTVYEEVIKNLLPNIYQKIIKEENIRPIIVPKFELEKAKEGEDWIIKAITCEKPEVKLGDYKEKVKNIKTDKHKKIWVPGEDEKKQNDQKDKESKPKLDDIFKALLSEVKVIVPKVLIEQEVNKLLSDLIDQTRKVGLTVEQYLSSKGITLEKIKQEYHAQAVNTLSLEFTLEEIANQEKIAVTEKDIENTIAKAKTKKEKDELSNQKYYIASILRRQKTLDYLVNL